MAGSFHSTGGNKSLLRKPTPRVSPLIPISPSPASWPPIVPPRLWGILSLGQHRQHFIFSTRMWILRSTVTSSSSLLTPQCTCQQIGGEEMGGGQGMNTKEILCPRTVPDVLLPLWLHSVSGHSLTEPSPSAHGNAMTLTPLSLCPLSLFSWMMLWPSRCFFAPLEVLDKCGGHLSCSCCHSALGKGSLSRSGR